MKSGEWIIGRPDLLGIIGRSRRELDHCAVIAWLLDPRGAHGLRTHFLEELLRKAFPKAPDFPPDDLALAWTETEVTRSTSRADIVVYLPEAIVVIEAKIDADEQDEQCDRLVGDWGF